MLNKTAFALFFIALGLLVTSGAVLSQELPRAYGEVGTVGKSQIPAQLQVYRPLLSVLGTQGYVPPAAGACVCTNLRQVSVICEDCDNEKRVQYCHTHDRACQDAAQKGGIREHTTFFCTTADQ